MKSYIKRAATAQQPWTIPDLCASYDWPVGLPPGGIISIVELGGGWNASDVVTAFSRMNLPVPLITNISVDGTVNSPGGDADAEVALDIQVAGAAYSMATGEAAVIRIYWSQDIAAAVDMATRDGCAVCSISWGAPEEEWGTTAVYEMNVAAVNAHKHGMAVFAAAGDNDADDGAKTPSVDCPACCPQVIGCGGTTKPRVGVETVWNNNPGRANGEGTGGGFSRYFPSQPWQIGSPKPPHGLGRMVPDVAGNADPNTGYVIVLNAQEEVIGGTSAVAPLWAGLVAAVWGKAPGWILPSFYTNKVAFNDVTFGGNGTYAARIGPDPCTGLGVPVASKLK